MPDSRQSAEGFLARLRADGTADAFRERLAPKPGPAAPFPSSARIDPASVERRWNLLGRPQPAALQGTPPEACAAFQRSIENFVGTVQVPVGVAGPLRVNGLHAQGDHWVPLATTEAALVASYARGCTAITDAGGCATLVTGEGVTRSPGFLFDTAADAAAAGVWIIENVEALRAAAATTTRHGRLDDVRFTLEGSTLYVHCDYFTGDAAGQNMVTLATQAVCERIVAGLPRPPRRWFVEANMSGDKKASAHAFQHVRGRKVVAEIALPAPLVAARLRTTADAMVEYWRTSAIGGILSGTLGVQGHYANGLAALFLATGQDVACVAEAAVGVTRMEVRDGGTLYASVTLPNIIVGTVGGATVLPSQAACLDLLGFRGDGKARALAEVAGALCLAGELSIIAALSAGHFTRAHAKRARGSTHPAREG